MAPFSYMQLANSRQIESIYSAYQKDPSSVESSWRYFFEGMEFGGYESPKEGGDFRLFGLIESYRKFGHLKAMTNPLQKECNRPHELEISALGFKVDELKKSFLTYGLLEQKEAPLEKIIEALEQIYCGTVSVEYMGCHYPDMERWIQERIEKSRFQPKLTVEEKKLLFEQLNRAELFETFIHTRYVGQKRFSLEGTETVIPVLADLIETSGSQQVVIGMAHRGRLNVLANILQKSYAAIFSEFEDFLDPDWVGGDGDVKYHKGFSTKIKSREGRTIHLSLTSNPSHLESVNPVAMGKAYAKLLQYPDRQTVPILIHGDSSIAGQGVVYEAMQLSQVPGYATGGTLHVVINNQIGFTTLPDEYRSTPCSTDIAHAFSAPVFHVNAEDPQACAYVARLATEIRNEFHCDVFIEINGYRKYGHNESDEPAFTQPLHYEMIRAKKSIREIYRDQLLAEGSVEKSFVEMAEKQFHEQLAFELEEFKVKPMRIPDEAFGGVWEGFVAPTDSQVLESVPTAVDESLLRQIAKRVERVPEGFNIHRKLEKLVKQRAERLDGEIDWGTAEQLAFGSILEQGHSIRISGQDSQRGTFSHRHAAWVDQKSGEKYFPLQQLGDFTVYNSPLSEFGVMGFEFGYSLATPNALICWEAQFGDFANGAQVIIDQYLSCSASKWSRYSGLVLLLPHGYEGQGSEHSSARLERYLQLSAQSNWRVCYPTTPAQYFHLLRRQVATNYRVPLVVMTPKELLRHPQCISQLADLTDGGFEEILVPDVKKARKLIFCSGHVAFDLLGHDDIAVVRIEQLYPLHEKKLQKVLKQFEGAEILWVQEEPQNMGAWSYISPYIPGVAYVGRRAASAPATSSPKRHKMELAEIVKRALG
ncbi:MAG: Multifunctional 2-oxoglutarate metabolism enzyme [Chlamydiales bacterium]|nr:Multifunctional 2-oxoglutarate metabolism enzyme [Chlamydiales bacterium]MCH9635998.1 Multifunctional 2-oxoglutarate metabolism enzyme [Chlamydiales bacterium]